MFVSYSRKGDRTYARLVTSRRVDGKVVKETSNLGRVVDRERNVFRSRERGTFTFDPATGEFGPAPSGGWPPPAELLVLDFGDTWALDSLATSEGLWAALDAASPSDPDELRCLCLHYALAPSQPNCLAKRWWEGSWARMAYPSARLASQRVSELLRRVGDEAAQRRFFDAYLAWVAGMADGTARVSVDSTGLPNSSRMPLTAVSSHNGQVSEECRLTYVLEQSTGLPVYLRVAAGNVVDVTTLERTAIDCACDLPPAESICVVDAVFRVLCAPDRFTGRCRARDPEELRAELLRALARQGRRRGVKRARAVIGIADPFSESPGESVARLVVRASGLPAPVTQYRYEDREEGRRYYIDLAWPQLRIAIEFDGFMKYVSPEDLRAEKRRELRLRRGGWTVFRLVWKDLRQPDLLISRLLGLFPPDSAARDQRVRHLL